MSRRTRTTGSWAGTRSRCRRSWPTWRTSRAGQRALDVGCGPGALTAELVARLGADVGRRGRSFGAVRGGGTRATPGVDVRHAPADALPFDDDIFDAALAQLVVHFMADPVAGLREMARVTRPGGVVAASVWDHAGDGGPLAAFWDAARDLDPAVADESRCGGRPRGPPRARSSRRPACATSMQTVAAAARASDLRGPGGSHSPSASGRPAPTCPAWLRRPVRTCANVVECDSAMARSRSGPVPGPPGAWPRPRGARSRRLGPARLEDDDGRPGRSAPSVAVEIAPVPADVPQVRPQALALLALGGACVDRAAAVLQVDARVGPRQEVEPPGRLRVAPSRSSRA